MDERSRAYIGFDFFAYDGVSIRMSDLGFGPTILVRFLQMILLEITELCSRNDNRMNNNLPMV